MSYQHGAVPYAADQEANIEIRPGDNERVNIDSASQTIRRNLGAVLLVAVFMVASVFVVAFSPLGRSAGLSSLYQVGSARTAQKHDFTSSGSSVSSNKVFGAGVQTSPVFLGLQRVGYSALPYFMLGASSVKKYAFLSGYDGVVEPYAPMNLFVSDYDESVHSYYTYSLCKNTAEGTAPPGDSSCFSGVYNPAQLTAASATTSISAQCSPFDTYTLSASEVDADTGLTKRGLTSSVMCMYVRREIRELSEEDLAKTMDAMSVLWAVDENAGKDKYGSSFHAAAFFAEAHHFNAAWSDGDHIHEGLGFLPQHLKLTNMFESAMQAVDPSVTLPYWDYTIEGAADQTIFDSFVFTPEVFGTLREPEDKDMGYTYTNNKIEDGRIFDGRWANITVHSSRYKDLNYNYGFLRAPWNTNPSPYVSRFPGYTTPLPVCGNFYSWLSETETLSDFLSYSPYAPHASVHGAVGSIFGCDLLTPLTVKGIITDTTEQISLCEKWGFIMKEMYRKNRISMQTDCTYELSEEDGGTISSMDCDYKCNDDDGDFNRVLAEAVGTKHTGTLNNAQKAVLADFVCGGDASKILLGDQIESASPADPSFWPIHPTLERAMQAKLMSSGFPDMVWPSDAANEYVCDKSNCYEDGVLDAWDQCCYGHYEYDQLLNFVSGDKSTGYGPTNREMIDGTNPTSASYNMPYIYGHFEWSHCTINFSDLLDRLAANAELGIYGDETDSTAPHTHKTNTAEDEEDGEQQDKGKK